ncbi:MAG: helix-turn-helix domain-containing protein [Tagaea sp.]|jgi:transcriptional regulator with XRE-family HTH domain|nr:helix-turn-helix transcriptional regulator [Azospirillum sp.]MCA3267349.1 helix-turn-helix transcriptional regulator [Azospirillum sp.]MCZ8123857.1 helix-turn-helix transcriptional regulator [Magnetospirillum sp.]
MSPASSKKSAKKSRVDRVAARRTTPVDVQVGRNVRKRRIELGLSQTELADACGITFQQVQKYENGVNRVSASRLWQFAAVLGLQVGAFFDGLGRPAARARLPLPDPAARKIDDETAKIARRLAAIEDPKLRQRIKSMLGAMAGGNA